MTKLMKLALGAIVMFCKPKEGLALDIIPGCGGDNGEKRKRLKAAAVDVGFASDVNNVATLNNHSSLDTLLADSIEQSNRTAASLVDGIDVMTNNTHSNNSDLNHVSVHANEDIPTSDKAEAAFDLVASDSGGDGAEAAHDTVSNSTPDVNNVATLNDHSSQDTLLAGSIEQSNRAAASSVDGIDVMTNNTHSNNFDPNHVSVHANEDISITSDKAGAALNLVAPDSRGDGTAAHDTECDDARHMLKKTDSTGVAVSNSSKSQALPIIEPVQRVLEVGTSFYKDKNSRFYYDSNNIQFERTGDLYVKTSSLSDTPKYYDHLRKRVEFSFYKTLFKTSFRINENFIDFAHAEYYDEKNNRFTRKGDTFIRGGLVFTSEGEPLDLKRCHYSVYSVDARNSDYFYDRQRNKYKKEDGLYRKDQNRELFTKNGKELEFYWDDVGLWRLWREKENPVNIYDMFGNCYEAEGDMFVTGTGKMFNRHGQKVSLDFVAGTKFWEDKNSSGAFYDQKKIQYKKREDFYEVRYQLRNMTYDNSLYDDQAREVTFKNVPGTVFTSTGDGFYYDKWYIRFRKVGDLYITVRDYFVNGSKCLRTASGNLVVKDPKTGGYQSVANENEKTLRFYKDDENFIQIV